MYSAVKLKDAKTKLVAMEENIEIAEKRKDQTESILEKARVAFKEKELEIESLKTTIETEKSRSFLLESQQEKHMSTLAQAIVQLKKLNLMNKSLQSKNQQLEQKLFDTRFETQAIEEPEEIVEIPKKKIKSSKASVSHKQMDASKREFGVSSVSNSFSNPATPYMMRASSKAASKLDIGDI